MNSNLSRPKSPRHGGCLAKLGVAFLIFLLLAGIGIYLMFRWAEGKIVEWTSEAPVPVPQVEVSDAQRAAIEQRVEAFRIAVTNNQVTPPLVLSALDLNVLAQKSPELRDKVYITMDGSTVGAQLSVRLGDMGSPIAKDRYLNGKGTLKVALANGILFVSLDSLEVNGKPLPEDFLQAFRQKNLAEEAMKDPETSAELAKFKSIDISNGQMTITGSAGP